MNHLTGCFLCALVLLTSCNIEKRLYRPGWHFDWVKSDYKGADRSEPAVIIADQDIRPVPGSVPEIPDITIRSTEIIVPEIQPVHAAPILTNEKAKAVPFPGTKQTSPYAVASFAFSFLSFIVMFLALSNDVFLFLFILFALIAIIFSIMGIRQIERKDSNHTGLGFAIVGLLVGIIGIFTLIGAFFL